MIKQCRSYVAGNWVEHPRAERLPIVCPMDETVIAELQEADAVIVDRAVAAYKRVKTVRASFEQHLRNPLTGKLTFGDGIRGIMPAAGRNNIVARRYQVGGGVKGNVNAMTLTQLTRAIAYVDKCYNVMPAAGGSSMVGESSGSSRENSRVLIARMRSRAAGLTWSGDRCSPSVQSWSDSSTARSRSPRSNAARSSSARGGGSPN